MTKTFTPKQAGELLSCSDDTVIAHISSGELEAINIGLGKQRKRWIITEEAIESFLRRRAKTIKPPTRRKPAAAPVRDWLNEAGAHD